MSFGLIFLKCVFKIACVYKRKGPNMLRYVFAALVALVVAMPARAEL